MHQASRNGIGLCRLFSRSKTEERHKEDFVCKDSIYMMTERLTKLFRSALLALWGAFSLFSAANAQKVADSQNATTAAALPHLEIDGSQIAAHVSSTLYGLMTEEINYSYDGGLYGELVRNRIFKDDASAPVHWSVVQDKQDKDKKDDKDKDKGAAGAIALDEAQPLNDVLTTSLRLDLTAASDSHRAGHRQRRLLGHPGKSWRKISRLVLCKGRQRFHRSAYDHH